VDPVDPEPDSDPEHCPSELVKLVKVVSTCLEGPDIWRGWGMSCLPPPTNLHRVEHLQKREEISTPDSNSKNLLSLFKRAQISGEGGE
jgi:hypothetical protein